MMEKKLHQNEKQGKKHTNTVKSERLTDSEADQDVSPLSEDAVHV